MKRNIKLLRQIEKWLRTLRHKEHFDMDIWVKKDKCGTAYCIAGKALQLSGYKFDRETEELVRPDGSQFAGFNPEGCKVLGLNQQQASRLFMVEAWPAKFYLDDDKNNPKNAANRIDYFIKTGK